MLRNETAFDSRQIEEEEVPGHAHRMRIAKQFLRGSVGSLRDGDYNLAFARVKNSIRWGLPESYLTTEDPVRRAIIEAVVAEQGDVFFQLGLDQVHRYLTSRGNDWERNTVYFLRQALGVLAYVHYCRSNLDLTRRALGDNLFMGHNPFNRALYQLATLEKFQTDAQFASECKDGLPARVLSRIRGAIQDYSLATEYLVERYSLNIRRNFLFGVSFFMLSIVTLALVPRYCSASSVYVISMGLFSHLMQAFEALSLPEKLSFFVNKYHFHFERILSEQSLPAFSNLPCMNEVMMCLVRFSYLIKKIHKEMFGSLLRKDRGMFLRLINAFSILLCLGVVTNINIYTDYFVRSFLVLSITVDLFHWYQFCLFRYLFPLRVFLKRQAGHLVSQSALLVEELARRMIAFSGLIASQACRYLLLSYHRLMQAPHHTKRLWTMYYHWLIDRKELFFKPDRVLLEEGRKNRYWFKSQKFAFAFPSFDREESSTDFLFCGDVFFINPKENDFKDILLLRVPETSANRFSHDPKQVSIWRPSASDLTREYHTKVKVGNQDKYLTVWGLKLRKPGYWPLGSLISLDDTLCDNVEDTSRWKGMLAVAKKSQYVCVHEDLLKGHNIGDAEQSSFNDRTFDFPVGGNDYRGAQTIPSGSFFVVPKQLENKKRIRHNVRPWSSVSGDFKKIHYDNKFVILSAGVLFFMLCYSFEWFFSPDTWLGHFGILPPSLAASHLFVFSLNNGLSCYRYQFEPGQENCRDRVIRFFDDIAHVLGGARGVADWIPRR